MSDITPTHEHYIDVPPQLVDAVREDPEVLAQLSRAQLLLVQHKLAKKFLYDDNATVAQGTAVAEVLRKTANLEPKGGAGGAGSGFSITINIPGTDKSLVVEGAAERITEEDSE